MTWSLGTITFLLGIALIIAAIFGGGLEVKEIKIPSMGRIARGISFAFGAGLLGLSLTQPQMLQSLAQDPSSGSGTIAVASQQEKSLFFFNVLDSDQESERVEVLMEGKSIGVLDIDKVKTTAGLTYKTKNAAIAYTIKGAQIFKVGDQVQSFQLAGSGALEVVDGSRYRLWQVSVTGNEKKVRFKQDKN